VPAQGEFSIGSDVWPGTSKLIEEMGELQQILGKLIGAHGEARHFDGSNLRERLVDELADVLAAVRFFQEANLAKEELEQLEARRKHKEALFKTWHTLHQEATSKSSL